MSAVQTKFRMVRVVHKNVTIISIVWDDRTMTEGEQIRRAQHQAEQLS